MAEGTGRTLYNSSGTEVATAGNPLRTDPTGGTTQPISAASLPLPTDAATAAKQDTGNSSLSSIDGKVATAAKQDSGNSSLSSIDGKLPADPAKESGKLTTIDSTLTAIKSTDGVKKIVDALPTGTNEIGKVAQGTKAAGSAAWPQVLYDASGNVVGVVLDDTIYRVQADAKIAKGGSALVHLDAIDTTAGKGRLKTTIYTPDGDPVSFGASVAPNPTNIRNDFCLNGSAQSLLVDGSSTPQVFSYNADSTDDISLQEIKFTLVANSVTFGSDYFGARSGPLANGLLVEVVSNGQTGTIYNLLQNESFVNYASPGGFEWVVSSKDLMSATWVVGGGLRLHAGTSDKVRVTVRDNLAAAGVYFKCFVKGNLIPAS